MHQQNTHNCVSQSWLGDHIEPLIRTLTPSPACFSVFQYSWFHTSGYLTLKKMIILTAWAHQISFGASFGDFARLIGLYGGQALVSSSMQWCLYPTPLSNCRPSRACLLSFSFSAFILSGEGVIGSCLTVVFLLTCI